MSLLVPPPPRLEELPAGTRLVAGLGHATVLPDIDFETYSEAGYVWNDEKNRWEGPPGAPKNSKGLPVVGAAVYSKHPTCEVIWCAYDLKDGKGKRQWFPGMPAPMDLIVHVVSGGLLEAWNAPFERWIWENVCSPKYGWPAVQSWQWRCAMAKARASGYPGALGMAGKVMGLETQKDKDGGDLMKVFSMPRQPTAGDPRRRIRPLYTVEQAQTELKRRLAHQWSQGMEGKRDSSIVSQLAKAQAAVQEEMTGTYRYGAYNVTDIASEAEASSKVPDLEGEELLWWQTHEKINHRGVHIDRVGVENCIAVVEQALKRYNGELVEITGIDSASKVEQLQGWLRAQGVHLDSLDEENVSAALAWPTLQGPARRVLEIRAAVGSASVKKLFAIRNALDDDDRLRDLYIYYGARTGRSTGDGPQPTNLPKAGPDTYQCGAWHERKFVEGSGCQRYFGKHHKSCPHCKTPLFPKPRSVEWNPEVAEFALGVISHRSLEYVEYVFGDALLTVAGCIRGLFDAAPGHDLISTDYNSIEAVGLAMVTGEKWRIDVFKGDGKIYERSASAAFKVPYEEFASHKDATGQHHPLRQKGKVMELACFGSATEVLTARGYVRLTELHSTDLLWDGVEWVKHAGLIPRGRRQVIDLDGIEVTPDHKILCGRSWREARQLVSNPSILSRALATASESLFSSRSSGQATLGEPSWLATAAQLRTSSPSTIFERAERLVARPAPTRKPARRSKGSLPTPMSYPITSIGGAFSIGSLPRSVGATTPATRRTATTGPAESWSTQRGEATAEFFSSTLSALRAGTTRAWRWTVETLTGRMARGTFGSSPSGSTPPTSAPSRPFKPESLNWSVVYDIALVGPRNRFTIRTNSGHLIVHNCGYQGWIGAAQAFDMPGTEDEIKADILAWRRASPAVEWFWGGQTIGKAYGAYNNARLPDYTGDVDDRLAPALHGTDRWDRREYYFGVEGMAVNAMLHPNEWHHVTRLDGTYSGVSFQFKGKTLYCRIPSGRVLTYHAPALVQSDRGEWALSYEGWNTNPKNGPKGWIRMNTWGGRLTENIIQATCRDILRTACIALEEFGYSVVLHVYDEIVAEVLQGWGSIEEFERIVTTIVQERAEWCRPWPIRAPGGYRARRYRKG